MWYLYSGIVSCSLPNPDSWVTQEERCGVGERAGRDCAHELSVVQDPQSLFCLCMGLKGGASVCMPVGWSERVSLWYHAVLCCQSQHTCLSE